MCNGLILLHGHKETQKAEEKQSKYLWFLCLYLNPDPHRACDPVIDFCVFAGSAITLWIGFAGTGFAG